MIFVMFAPAVTTESEPKSTSFVNLSSAYLQHATTCSFANNHVFAGQICALPDVHGPVHLRGSSIRIIMTPDFEDHSLRKQPQTAPLHYDRVSISIRLIGMQRELQGSCAVHGSHAHYEHMPFDHTRRY